MNALIAPQNASAENIPDRMTRGHTNATAAKASEPASFRKIASIRQGEEVSNAPMTPGTASLNIVGASGAPINGDGLRINLLLRRMWWKYINSLSGRKTNAVLLVGGYFDKSEATLLMLTEPGSRVSQGC